MNPADERRDEAPQDTPPRAAWSGLAAERSDADDWFAAQSAMRAGQAVYRQQQAEQALGDAGLTVVRRLGMTLERFNPALLRSAGDNHPFNAATAWLGSALERGPRADYHDGACPPAALYLYSPTRGCGKTHLAAGIGIEAAEQGQLVALFEEGQFLRRYWSGTLDEQSRLVALAGHEAWLLIVDDLGQCEKAGPAVADAWNAVLNLRWLHGGWTIITSNATPDELLDRGTINRSTYSRLAQMLRRQIVYFDGQDQRLLATT